MSKNIVSETFQKLKLLFFSPSKFFKSVEKEALWISIVWLSVVFLLGSFVKSLASILIAASDRTLLFLTIITELTSFIIAIFTVPFMFLFVLGIIHLVIMIFKGKSGILSTLKVSVYSVTVWTVYTVLGSILVYLWTVLQSKLLGIFIILLFAIGLIYTMILLVVGLSQYHKVSKKKSFVAAITPFIILLLIIGAGVAVFKVFSSQFEKPQVTPLSPQEFTEIQVEIDKLNELNGRCWFTGCYSNDSSALNEILTICDESLAHGDKVFDAYSLDETQVKKVKAAHIDSKGFVLQKLGRFNEAIELYKEALVLDPSNKEHQMHLECALNQKDNPNDLCIQEYCKKDMFEIEENSFQVNTSVLVDAQLELNKMKTESTKLLNECKEKACFGTTQEDFEDAIIMCDKSIKGQFMVPVKYLGAKHLALLKIDINSEEAQDLYNKWRNEANVRNYSEFSKYYKPYFDCNDAQNPQKCIQETLCI